MAISSPLPVQSKSADHTDGKIKPSVLQEGNLGTSGSQRRTPGSRPGIVQLELLQREMQECLVKATRKQAIGSGRSGGESTILIESDSFMSGNGSHSAAVEGGITQRAHKTNSGYFTPCCGVPESHIKTTEQNGCVEEAVMSLFANFTTSSR